MYNNLALNRSGLSKELNLMLEIMRMEDYLDLKPLDSDWNLFLHFVKHHRVYPTIFKKLKGIDNELVPQKIVDSLYRLYQKNTFHMLQLSGESEKIAGLFANHEICTLFLKGPAMAVDLYGDISLRTCGDLDLMIPITDLEKADAILAQEGYVKDDYIKSVLNDWRWRHHHVTYFHNVSHIKVEIHWRLNPGPGIEPCFDKLWDRKRKYTLASKPIYLLGREDLFLFLVTHGARHGWSRLRWLEDISQLVKQELNIRKLSKLLRQYHSQHVAGQALILASLLLNVKIEDNLKPLIESKRATKLAYEALYYQKQMINLHSEPLPIEIANYHKRHLYSLMSNYQKLLFLSSFLYPYPVDADTLPLPKSLHFLYFPLHPILWMWRKSRNLVLRKGAI